MNKPRPTSLFLRRSFSSAISTTRSLIAVGVMLTGFVSAADFSEKVVTSAKSGTLRIFSERGSGTGFVINRQGHIVTNYHVIEGSSNILVIFVNGDKAFEISASIAATEPAKDLAILKCDLPFRIKPFAVVSRETTGGQTVMALGFPGLLDKAFSPTSSGGMRATGKPGEYALNDEAINFLTPVVFPGSVGKEMNIDSGYRGIYRAIAHNAKISEGNSGGPLIDLEGRVVGVNAKVGGSDFGIDYAFSIHASELIALARAHSIPIDVTSSKASARGSVSGIHLLLYIVLAAFAVVMFLMVLRKPRMAMVDAVSRVVHPGRGKSGFGPTGHGRGFPKEPRPERAGLMRLRGRDLHGLSYDLTFSPADFQRYSNRLVIGRNNDLSQLVLSQDSVSRQHATLTLAGTSVQVEDRNSGNGTKVNGRELRVGQPAAPLNPGDKLTLGEVDLIFEIQN